MVRVPQIHERDLREFVYKRQLAVFCATCGARVTGDIYCKQHQGEAGQISGDLARVVITAQDEVRPTMNRMKKEQCISFSQMSRRAGYSKETLQSIIASKNHRMMLSHLYEAAAGLNYDVEIHLIPRSNP